ncbi:hypothetical protein M6B38_193325 [Iris pallida]|uniref:Uncharacterized protein n=1 Tax=Iris pallida TaxID=29817 RepID=A0AAX6EE48_IRIPA|nr:hypothetical protein M6B38_193325 [Iris pallida]
MKTKRSSLWPWWWPMLPRAACSNSTIDSRRKDRSQQSGGFPFQLCLLI